MTRLRYTSVSKLNPVDQVIWTSDGDVRAIAGDTKKTRLAKRRSTQDLWQDNQYLSPCMAVLVVDWGCFPCPADGSDLRRGKFDHHGTWLRRQDTIPLDEGRGPCVGRRGYLGHNIVCGPGLEISYMKLVLGEEKVGFEKPFPRSCFLPGNRLRRGVNKPPRLRCRLLEPLSGNWI
jgi:hypothetical protein